VFYHQDKCMELVFLDRNEIEVMRFIYLMRRVNEQIEDKEKDKTGYEEDRRDNEQDG